MKTIQKFKRPLQVLVATFILFLVFLDAGQFIKNISFGLVRHYLNSFSIAQLLAIVFLGLLTPIPAIGYDLVLNRKIKSKENGASFLKLSYAINAYNQALGLFGLVHSGLSQFFFYPHLKDSESFQKNISSILPFRIAGLSILSLASSILILAHQIPAYEGRYAILVLVFSLYFILLLALKKYVNWKRLGQLTLQEELALLLTSLVNWLVITSNFLLTGLILGIQFHPLEVASLLVVAYLIGILSTLPAGIGAFDMLVLSGLISMGIQTELAVTWILFYRLGTLIIPFFTGTFIFLNKLISDSKSMLAQDLTAIIKGLLHKLNAAFIYLYGLLFIAPIVELENIKIVGKMTDLLLRMHLNLLNNFLAIAIGIVYVFIGRLVFNKQEKAIKILVPTSVVTVVYLLLNEGGWWSCLPIIFMLGLTLLTQSQHYRIQFLYAWEELTVDVTILLLVTLTSFHQVGQMLFSHSQIPVFISLIYIAAFLTIIFFLMHWLLHYLRSDQDHLRRKQDKADFLTLKAKYGTSMDGNLYLTGDKYIYYYQNENEEKTVAFQYALEGNKILVFSEPFGQKSDVDAALEDFIQCCDKLSYQLVFYEIGEEITLKLHEYGYHFLKVGELALVNAQNFSLEGHRMKNQRYVLSRFQKDGLEFQVLKGPHDEKTLSRLKEISDMWLEGRKEMGYSLGFFQKDYIQASDVAIVRNGEGNIVAFANLIPDTKEKKIGIDLMRFDKILAPNSTMDYIFLKLILYAQEESYDFFSLGVAPLSNVGIKSTAPIVERFVRVIYKYGNSFYSFTGLRRYKEKYANKWQPHYISYSPQGWLLYAVFALLMATQRPVEDIE